MHDDVEFVSGEEARRAAGTAAAEVLARETASTLPVPLSSKQPGVLLVLYYKEFGPPAKRKVYPPHYAMHLDGRSARVLRFWACTPEEVGIVQPQAVVEGAGIRDGMTGEEFFEKRQRLLAISPQVWSAFARGVDGGDATVRDAAREYRTLFLEITKREVAPFYVQAAADFFRWVDRVAVGH
jgi:hypothetical protein